MTEHVFALPVETKLNHYVIESVLGQGGFGVVYKAHHALLRQMVVIKEFLPVELASRMGATVVPHGTSKQEVYDNCLERFLDEGRTLVALNHTNVVRCRDLFTANGTAYLVMDFEDGLALDELVKGLEEQNKHYTQEQLLHFLIPLADGLDYIHKQGVLHRDIKPANVFIRRADGSPVLIDFGAAKQNFALASQSQAPYTEFYAPMEQIEGGGEAKPTIDIHAFGALIYRIITGSVGAKAESRTLAIARNKSDPLKNVSSSAKGDFSADFLSLVDQCLAFDAEDRPQQMASVKNALKMCLKNSSTTPLEKPQKPTVEIPATKHNASNEPLKQAAPLEPKPDEFKPATQAKINSDDLPRDAAVSMSESSVAVEQKDRLSLKKWLMIAVLSCSLMAIVGVLIFSDSEAELKVMELTKQAKNGDQKARFELGVKYYSGTDVALSYSEAFKWFRAAANDGHAGAQFNLAVMYDTGKGVNQSPSKAMTFYQKAAAQGLADAQYLTGVGYAKGRGIKQSDEDAVKWYTLAAKQGHDKAQYNLGRSYALGSGITQSDEQSIYWYRAAARSGNVPAKDALRGKRISW